MFFRGRPLQVQAVQLADGGPTRRFSPVMVAPIGADWGSKPRQDRFRVEPDGSVPGVEWLAGELFGHGRGRAEWRSPPVFEVNFPEPGRLILHLSEIRRGAAEIRLDGKLVLRDEASRDKDSGRNAAKDLAVDVPAGCHEITLDNAGSDVVRFAYLILTNYYIAMPRAGPTWTSGGDKRTTWPYSGSTIACTRGPSRPPASTPPRSGGASGRTAARGGKRIPLVGNAPTNIRPFAFATGRGGPQCSTPARVRRSRTTTWGGIF